MLPSSSGEPERPAIRIGRIFALVCYILFIAILALLTLHPAGGSWLVRGAQAEVTTATVPEGGDPAQLARHSRGITGLE